MIPHRPGDSMAASNHFSFSQSPQRSQEHGDRNYGVWTRPPRSPVNPVVEEELPWLAKRNCADDSGSGTPSPPLWKSYSPSRTPPRPTMSRSSESCPARDEVSMYMSSRAQAIAGYRREMLDLVRGLPESGYELSLRDIVETSSAQQQNEEEQVGVLPLRETEIKKKEEDMKKKKKVMGTTTSSSKNNINRRIARSASLDTGLLIKMFSPLSVGGKRKSLGANSGAGAKVSPKPNSKEKEKEKKLPRNKEAKKKEKMVMVMEEKEEEEWWEKGEFSDNQGAGSSSGTSSRTSSTGSNGNGNNIGASTTTRTASLRSRSRKKSGCYAFFRCNKSRTRGA